MFKNDTGCAPSQYQRVRGGVGHDDDRRRSRRPLQHPPWHSTPWSLPGTKFSHCCQRVVLPPNFLNIFCQISQNIF